MKTLEDYERLENILYTDEQINQIRRAYSLGCTDEEVATFAKPEIPALIMVMRTDDILEEKQIKKSNNCNLETHTNFND